MCIGYRLDPNQVFLYYGTFSRTTLSMFEILFANWAPACRVLVENVSEWFSLFFLAYRCDIGSKRLQPSSLSPFRSLKGHEEAFHPALKA